MVGWVILLLTRGLEFLQSIEVDQAQDKKFRQGFVGAPAVVMGRKQVAASLACLFIVEGR